MGRVHLPTKKITIKSTFHGSVNIPGNSMDSMGCEVIHSWMFNSSLLKKQAKSQKEIHLQTVIFQGRAVKLPGSIAEYT